MTTMYAWTLKDGHFDRTGLWVHLMLIDRFFLVGTQWPDEKAGWYTREYNDAEAAQVAAVNHTGQLEKTGDTLEHDPVAIMVDDLTDALMGYVGSDVDSPYLDRLFDNAMINGLVEEVIP